MYRSIPTKGELGGVGPRGDQILQPNTRVDARADAKHALQPHDQHLETAHLLRQLTQALEEQLQPLVLQELLHPPLVGAA